MRHFITCPLAALPLVCGLLAGSAAGQYPHHRDGAVVVEGDYVPGEYVVGEEYYYGEQRGAVFPGLRAAIFRLYGGRVEMQTKTYYPPGYYGNYYFTPWRPIWIRDVPEPRPPLAVDRYWHDPFFEGAGHVEYLETPGEGPGDGEFDPPPPPDEDALDAPVLPDLEGGQ